MKRSWSIDLAVFAVLVVCCVAARLLPHPPNFAPVAAAAMFAGFFFGRWWLAAGLPVAVMLTSDFALGWHLPGVMATVYAALVAPVLWRAVLRRRLTALRVGGAAVGNSLLFFLTTNLAHWYFGIWFPHTLDGLIACYAAALPFLKYTLLGDLFWSAALFGAYAWACGAARVPAVAVGTGGGGDPRGRVQPAA